MSIWLIHPEAREASDASVTMRRGMSEQIIGIILVDHGSRRDDANALLEQVAQRFGQASRFDVVEPAHMELAQPSIATAFDRCVQRGATVVVVMPYFLAPGRHWDTDIPQLAAAAARKHPDTPYRIAAPLGLDDKMIDVVRQRIEQCLDEDEGGA